MESERYSIETVLTQGIVVKFDVKEHSLLVAQVEVILKLVVKLDAQLLYSWAYGARQLSDYLTLIAFGLFLIIRVCLPSAIHTLINGK